MNTFNKIVPSNIIILLVIVSLIPNAYSLISNTTIGNAPSPSTPPTKSNKIVILTFDDAWKSQFINAKPILDKYGFKATFFTVCNYVGRDNNTRMNWQDVLSLQNDGMDIESHTMNHKDLTKLSAAKLDYEIGQSKQCLHSHGITGPTIMATPLNAGWNNATVIRDIAKYYDLARSGNSDITFLHCDKWTSAQTDCRTFFKNGTLTYGNRYSIMAWNHNFYDNAYLHNDSRIYNKYIQVVNKQSSHNTAETVSAIPIIEYHDIANNGLSYSTNVDLFSAEMKYLHNSGFKIIPMSDIRYNNTNNFLYLKEN
jgi:peptidoglycan/xylan/chitin deacetylase (PgdA/CDA1 family)